MIVATTLTACSADVVGDEAGSYGKERIIRLPTAMR